ncbi:MAG: hypothetical protein JWO36_7081, partial [Myxococcales bacterium]|nr:hypothetical protein [Myxococcales bacterium]
STLHIATAPSPSGPFTERAKTFGTGFNYPTISSDGLELYYTPNGSLFHSVRPDQASDFPKGTDTGFTVYDPDLTPDGQTLVLGDGSSVLFLTRTCPTQ